MRHAEVMELSAVEQHAFSAYDHALSVERNNTLIHRNLLFDLVEEHLYLFYFSLSYKIRVRPGDAAGKFLCSAILERHQILGSLALPEYISSLGVDVSHGDLSQEDEFHRALLYRLLA